MIRFDIEDYRRKINRECLDIIDRYQLCYEKSVTLSDEECDQKEVSLFVYLLENGEPRHKLKEILVFQENDNFLQLVGHIIVDDIDKKGLIIFRSLKFVLDNEQLEREFVNLVFINIKELYHKHTHHDGDTSVADRLLPVCFTNDRKLGVAGIVKQFQKKIIFYNLLIKENFLVNNRKGMLWNPMVSVHEVIRQATGEFLYALNFINFYKDDIDHPEIYEGIFRNEISSVNAYSAEAESQYSLWLTGKITFLTVILVIFTIGLLLITAACSLRQAAIVSLSNEIHSLLYTIK